MSSPHPPEIPPTAAAVEREPGSAVSSDELLPPVEPPSAKFILQLFVVPAVIVAAVVLFWFVIESLARRGEQDPDQIVRALRSSNQARFQKAKDLADMLRLPQRYPELKRNRDLAQKLAALLDEQVAAGDDAEAAVTMRMFLCTALGEFYVDDGLATLVKAARSDPERDVRRRAINAIAALGGALNQLDPPQPLGGDDLVEALVALAKDPDELVRSETAFAIGVVAQAPDADPRLAAELEVLADDPYTDARFNAAVALARIGSPRAAPALAEMLDADSLASSLTGEKALTEEMSDEELRRQRTYKRDSIIHNALSAIMMLTEKRSLPPDSRDVLARALAGFVASAPAIIDPAPVPRELLQSAERTLAGMRGASANAAP